MQQEVIVHIEQISRRGELKYFQIPLPGTAKKIIAIETSAVLLTEGLVVPAPADTSGTIGGDTGGSGGSTNNNCPNPGTASIDPVSNTVANNILTQVFRIGAAVNPTFIYQCGVYSVVVSVTAVDGDTPTTIAAKLADVVNNTTLATWNQYGSNNHNYKPTASSNGDLITLTVDTQHSFFASAIGSCGNEPPPPPPPAQPEYDQLFRINNNEKAGKLSLQSPDITDIFFQAEIFREDRNINYADFSYSPLEIGEWIRGRKRIASDVLIGTVSPILEAYYKDSWGEFYGRDVSYQLNIYVWIEKQNLQV
ncbi:MAG: hypothetical protein E6H08_16005 [Bacteroidetes bacterium]|nr:MAG: hypothetical protein E6H08_16005 [Bacteroidota bacterium]